jgi:hypothetical protein
LIEFLEAIARAGGTVSGEAVQEGWAVHPFKGSRGHHWRRTTTAGEATGVETACGLRTIVTEQVRLLGIGTYEPCSRCERVLMKRATR